MGHSQAYQNHLNASVNLVKGTFDDLIQACRQYERLELQRASVSARKPPAVRSLGRERARPPAANVACLDPQDSHPGSETSDDCPSEADVCRTYARKPRCRGSRRSSSKKKSQVNTVEVAPGIFAVAGSEQSDPDDEEWQDGVELTEAQENLMDEKLLCACAALNALAPGASAGNLNRGYGDSRRPSPRYGNMICLYCQKRGHGIRYCRQLWSRYPDGKFPPELAQLVFSALMFPKGTGGQMRRQAPPTGQSRRAPDPNVRLALPSPGEAGEAEREETDKTPGTLNS